jgi:peptidoglycan/LPS O-acetylase OafA/YrhL
MWIWRDRIPFYRHACIPITALIVLLHNTPQEISLLTYVLPYAAISFALNPIPVVESTGRYGDFSYGIYIYGFVVQQTIMHLWPRIGVWEFLALSIVSSVLLGAGSWYIIERPALGLKRVLTPKRLASNLATSTAHV